MLDRIFTMYQESYESGKEGRRTSKRRQSLRTRARAQLTFTYCECASQYSVHTTEAGAVLGSHFMQRAEEQGDLS